MNVKPNAERDDRDDFEIITNDTGRTDVFQLGCIAPEQLKVGIDWYGGYQDDYEMAAVDALYKEAVLAALFTAVPGAYYSAGQLIVALDPGERIVGFYPGQIAELADIDPSLYAERCELLGH